MTFYALYENYTYTEDNFIDTYEKFGYVKCTTCYRQAYKWLEEKDKYPRRVIIYSHYERKVVDELEYF